VFLLGEFAVRGGAGLVLYPAYEARKLHCLQMGSWYWIGVCAGLGVAVGVLLAGLFAGTRIALTGALILAAAIGIGIGFALGDWEEAIGGGAGGVLGALGAAQLVMGTLRRGGARFGVAVFVGLAALILAGLAWIPAVGYLEATLVPALAARLRGRAPERYAGLRSLARD
jgi:hypothetical protein